MKYSQTDEATRMKISAELNAVRSARVEGARSELIEFRKTSIFLNGGGLALCLPILSYLDFSGIAWAVLLGGVSFLIGLLLAAIGNWASVRRYTSISTGITSVSERVYMDELDIGNISTELNRISRESGPRIRNWQLWGPTAAAFIGAACFTAVLIEIYLSKL